MKKVVAALLIIALSVALLSGCGSKKKEAVAPSETSSAKTEQSNDNNSTSNGDSTTSQQDVIEGAELSTFMGNYMDTKSKLWDAMSKELEKDPNNIFTFAALGYTMADLLIVEIGLYDTIVTKEGDMFKGKLMLSGIDAWKKVGKDTIEFGYDYNLKEDQGQKKSGDHEVAKGKFSKDTNSLIYEHYTERGGTKTQRYVVEITKNSDTSYSSQLFMIDNNDSQDSMNLSSYMTWFDATNFISFETEKTGVSIDFSYNSIYGKKNVKPEEMASGMETVSKASYIDGKAVFEQLKK